MRELLRHRQMRVYLVGQGLSLFGSMSLWLAAGIFVKTLTDSYGAAGMAFFCVALGTLCGPLGGVLVDRFPRRPLLIATNTAAALLLAPLLLVREPNQVWLLYTVLFGYGALHGLIASGQSALLAGMLPTELLPHANSALRTIQEGLRLLAPLAGAGLVAWQGFYAVVWLDIAGFLAAAVTLLLIRPQEAVVTKVKERFLDAVTAGMRHIRRHQALWSFTLACAAATSVIGFGESALFAVVDLGLDRPTAFVGVLLTAQGVGAIVAGPLAGALINRFGELRLAAVGLTLFASGNALWIVPSLPVTLMGAALAGAGLPWLTIGAITLMQRRSPPHLQGRVFSGFDLAVTVPQV
ncbi:MAG: MFS transporter, partial [Micromonosporaceae bacterium]